MSCTVVRDVIKDVTRPVLRDVIRCADGGEVEPGSAPVWSFVGPTFTIYEDQLPFTLDMNLYVTTPEGEPITAWSNTGAATIDNVGGSNPGLLSLDQLPGSYPITVTATNINDSATSNEFTVVVEAGVSPQLPIWDNDNIPNFYSVHGISGGNEVPPPPITSGVLSTTANSSGVDMSGYVLNKNDWPVSSYTVTPANVVTIHPTTGVLTGNVGTVPGKYQMYCTATNANGSASCRTFEWEVISQDGYQIDFDKTTVYPELGGLAHTRQYGPQDYIDHLAQVASAEGNTPALVGQEWNGSTYIERDVGYGIDLSADPDPIVFLTGSLADVDGLPDNGMEIEASGHMVFSPNKVPMFGTDFGRVFSIGNDQSVPVPNDAPYNRTDHSEICVFENTASATSLTLAVRTRDDNATDPGAATNGWHSITVDNIGYTPGDIVDLRFSISSTDGLRLWIYVNGVPFVENSQNPTFPADPQIVAIDQLSLGGASHVVNFYETDITFIHAHIVASGAVPPATIQAWPHWTHPVPVLPADHMNPTFVHVPVGTEPPENPEVAPGVIFQTSWENDYDHDTDTGWDFDSDGVFNPKQGTRWAGEAVGVPTGFWTAVCDAPPDPPAPAPSNVPTRRSRIEIDPVYGNRCWRRRGGDEWYVDEQGELKRVNNAKGNIYLGLPIGTRAAGYNDIYLRITMRWPTNNNYNYGSRGSYYKLGRFNANNYVPDDLMDPSERGRDQTGHTNASASEVIIQMNGGSAEGYYNRAPTFHVQPEDNWDDQYDTNWVVSPSNNTSPSAGTWGNIAQDGSTEEAHESRNPGLTTGQFVTYGDGNTGVEQEYHTIEYRIKANSAPYADNALVSIFYDGDEQVADGSTSDKPHFITELKANWKGKPNPAEYINSPINANGVGFNWLRIFDNLANWTDAWYGRRGDDFDGGEFIKDIVVSTERIGHSYKVAKEEGGAGFFQERGRNAQQVRNPGDCYIIRGNQRAPTEVYSPDYGCPNGYDVIAMFGFVAEHPVTPTWKHYRDIDNPGAVEPDDWDNGYELNDLPDWTARWGAMRYGQSAHNNSCCLTYSGSGLTADDNGYLELTIDDGQGGMDKARHRIDIVGEAY